MNSFFRKLPLPSKLMLIGLIPLLFLIYLTSSLYLEKTQKLTILGNYIDRIDQSANLTRLIDNLQKEREYSYEFALKKNRRQEMIAQRASSDSIIRQIEVSSDSTLRGFTNYSFLNNLRNTRNSIDSGRMNSDGVVHYFSATIFRLNTLNGVTPGNDVYLQTVYSDMAAQKLLSEMVTYLGLINANIFNILYKRTYVVETLFGTLPSYEVYNSYELELLQKASPQVIKTYRDIRRNSALKKTIDYLDTVFKRFNVDSSLDYKQWGEISSAGIDQLRGLQMNLLRNVETKVNNIYHKESTEKNRTLIFLIIALVLVVAIVSYTIHVINIMLNELKNAALKIANGETGFYFKNIPNDVIGSLAQSISKIDASNKLLAEAAESIGHGKFDVPLQPRSKHDLLGNALVKMKENLQRSMKENEESREEFRQLADFVPQIVWTARPDGYLDYYNRKWYEFTGFEEGYGDQSWISILHPDDVKNCTDSWYNSVQTGKPYEIEYRFKDRHHGGYRWFLGRAVPVRNAEGEIVKWFGTCTDIHEQKTMNEKMELLVKERTEELERSNDDLQQFAHVASHDLKEPLRKIRIFSGRLKEEFGASIPGDGVLYIDKIQGAAKRMAAMIEGVLHYSIASNVGPDAEVIDLNGIIHDIRQDLELVIQQKKAAFHYEPLPKIRGIRVLIYQLFYNLVNNALKFSKEEGKNEITISVKRIKGSEVNSSSHLIPNEEYLSIEIRDTGIGFDPEHSERMFQIFTRLNPRDKYEGTGLGLALCKKIALRHHGNIIATGKENEGASFNVLLPA